MQKTIRRKCRKEKLTFWGVPPPGLVGIGGGVRTTPLQSRRGDMNPQQFGRTGMAPSSFPFWNELGAISFLRLPRASLGGGGWPGRPSLRHTSLHWCVSKNLRTPSSCMSARPKEGPEVDGPSPLLSLGSLAFPGSCCGPTGAARCRGFLNDPRESSPPACIVSGAFGCGPPLVGVSTTFGLEIVLKPENTPPQGPTRQHLFSSSQVVDPPPWGEWKQLLVSPAGLKTWLGKLGNKILNFLQRAKS